MEILSDVISLLTEEFELYLTIEMEVCPGFFAHNSRTICISRAFSLRKKLFHFSARNIILFAEYSVQSGLVVRCFRKPLFVITSCGMPPVPCKK